MRVSRPNKTLQRMHRDYSRIFRVRKNFIKRKVNKLNKFLFFKKITLARWQFNTFTVMILSLGFVLGTYAMVTELVPRLMALDETSYTLTQGGDSELTAGSGTDVVISATAVSLGKDDNWFDMGWNLKKQLTVKNLSAVTLPANTPIQVTINTKELFDASNLQNDCDDLRIIYSTGVGSHTELTRSYYKASGATDCSDSTATVVTFPIQAEMTTGATSGNYYLYYKNPGATNPGFGDNGYNIGDAEATMVCPFNGTTTCIDGETPSAQGGALRYSGGSSLSFDGSDDYVNSTTFSHGDELSISIWFKGKPMHPTSAQLWRLDFGYMEWYASGSMNFWFSGAGGGHISAGNLQNYTDWHHLVLTLKANEQKIYLDGVLKTTQTTNRTFTDASATFRINDLQWSTRGYNGLIDEVFISKNYLTQTEVSRLYSESDSANDLIDSNVVLVYHMDENGDDPRNSGKAIDASGNGNHGTITGAKYVSGVAGIDSSTSSGQVKGQSYAGHEGVFIEEGTTNLITNPSFEHGTYSTNWGLNYFNYDNTLDTFTAKMAKRNSAGPFTAGVLIQGQYNTTNQDSIQASTGSNIDSAGTFKQTFDQNQGSIAFWITPEWNGNDGKLHIIYNTNAYSVNGIYKAADGNLCFDQGWSNIVCTSVSSWTAGTTYNVVFRWSRYATLSGANYFSVSINDTHVFANTVISGSPSSQSLFEIGNDDRSPEVVYKNPAEALIEGLTIYRRPLFDGTNGIDVGNGDELNLIYNSGTGKDPTLITGSWDVVFALPTNGTVGELATGNGNAWSHPHSSNLLYTSTTNTGGFMLNGTYTTDGWVSEGTPSSVTALASNEKIFSGGYKITSDAADEGIYYEKTVAAGNDWVVRGLAHSDGTCVPKIILYNQTGGAEIGSLTGTTTSVRTAPNTFIFTGEAPTGMTTLRIKLVNTASLGTCYWHQVEMLTNKISNPSFETGSGDPWLPSGHTTTEYSNAGDSSQETTVVHSGTSGVRFNSQLTILYDHGGTINNFYSLGAWMRETAGSQQLSYGENATANDGGTASLTIGASGDLYKHYPLVFRKVGVTNKWVRVGGTGTSYVDDLYSFELTNVSLTVTSASEANSSETTGLRVDGADTLTQTTTELSADRGVIKFKYTPRHNFADADKFGSANPTIFATYGAGSNYLYLRKESSTLLRVAGQFNGTTVVADWSNPTLNAGTTYDIEVNYTSGGSLNLLINGIQVATNTGVVSFSSIPTPINFGSHGALNQYDGTISNFTALTPTENTTSPYYKFGSKSVKLVNAGTMPDEYTIAIDPNATSTHTFSAYVYDGTTGNIGGTVSATVAKLIFGGNVVTPTSYTDAGGGWWRLIYSAATADASLSYGVQALAGKTIYVDGVQLEAKALLVTSYADGSLGGNYTWSGEAHNSVSTRASTEIYFPDPDAGSDFPMQEGTWSVWIRPENWSWNELSTKTTWTDSFGIMGTGWGRYDMTFNPSGQFTAAKWVDTAATARGLSYTLSGTGKGWRHFVFTFGASGAAIYENGILKNSSALDFSSTTANNSTLVQKIGQVWNWPVGHLNGSISDLRIFNAPLSDTAVLSLYNSGLANHQSGSEDDNKYRTTGDYETDILDLGNAGQWGNNPNLLITELLNGNTINYQTRTSEDNLVWSDYAPVTGSTPNLSISSPPKRYLQMKATLNSPNQNTTPVFNGAQINYVQDAIPPEVNATETTLKRTVSGDTIAENNYTNSQAPYFSWVAGVDDVDGSGLRGYCLYLGPDIAGNPTNDKGLLGSSPGSTANTTCPFVVTTNSIDFANTNLRGNTWLQSTTDSYYLIIRAVDNTGNVYDLEPEIFGFKFDNTPPTNPRGLFAPASYQRSFDSFVISWPSDGANMAQDAHSLVKGYQYKLGTNGTWYGGGHTGDQDCNDVLTTNTYALDADFDNLPSGETPFYLRTLDYACNTSASAISAILKYNSTAPSAPRDLSVTPVTNDKNEFSFTWLTPEIYQGAESNLSYCYTVNTLPTSGTCIFTSSNSLNPDAFATQPGENTFYVVSRDEASNINYGDYASIKFYANTSAPGVPRNLDVADISVKTTKNWRLTVSWDEPEDLGAGVAKYFIYRSFAENANCSENFSLFAKVGETAGGSYVDTNLQQKDHYYCVRACDSTNNCSAVSSTGSNFPDGKFTSPAILESAPVVSSVSTRNARISWITDRDSDSRISYGLASNDYFKEEVGNSEQRIDHDLILTNLEPGTTYYFQAKWTDEDGNLGLSDEYTFTTAPPPSVKDVVVSSVGISTAVINFTTTGSSKVNFLYGTSVGFGSSKEIATSPLESRYTTLLDGLSEGSKYYFRVDTEDDEGYVYEGTVLDFTTLPQPKLSNVRIQQVKNAAQPTVLVSWESNTEVTSVVSLFPEGNVELIREEVNLDLMSGEHQMIIRGLLPNTVYELLVKGSDKLGNQATSTAQRITTATDTRPPAISNVQIEAGKGNVTDSSQFIVTWTTDEPTTSQVEYGEGTGSSYPQRSQLDSNFTLDHTIVISGLAPGKVYHLRAVSTDDAENTTYSLDYVAITPKESNSAIELVISSLSRVFSFLR